MSWRPDQKEWEKLKIRHCNETLKDVGGAKCETCSAKPFTCNKSFEAGADAILEGIRKQPTTKPAELYLYGSLKGKWYFIPDDPVDMTTLSKILPLNPPAEHHDPQVGNVNPFKR